MRPPSYPPAFVAALAFTSRWEGGVANVAGDRGGLTNMGVTRATYDAYRRGLKLPVQAVTRCTPEERTDCFYRLYWLAAGCDKLPPKLSMAVFDTAVNSGPSKAKALLLATKDPVKYVGLRRAFLRRLALTSSQKKFLAGWMNRVDALKVAVS